MKLYNSTWPQIETYLERSNILILPLGSTEQHGPTGLIGTDFLTAWGIAERVAEELDVLVASPICYGMAQHHMAFPGTASLRPSTYSLVIKEIIESFIQHGLHRIFLINGHGGNIAPVLSAFPDVKRDSDNVQLQLISWFLLDSVQAYEKQHFGNQNGCHATPSEVSITMQLETAAFYSIETCDFAVEPMPSYNVYQPHDFRRAFPDGRMGSNPGLATAQHGKALLDIATDTIKALINPP